jgi:hypothetical protein
MNHRILFVFTSLVVVAVVVSAGVTYSLFPRTVTVDKEVQVPIETVVEVPTPSFLEHFDIREARYVALDFGDNSFTFVNGEFSFCDMDWRGYWDSKVIISKTSIKNCTFYLTNLDLELENCDVENCHFEGTFDSAVYLNSTTFTGANVFDVSVVDKGGNKGLENVVFNGQVFPWEF